MNAEKSIISPREQMLQRVREWSASSEDIRALVLVGSGARQDNPADDWSDIDLVLVAQDQHRYLQSTSWFAEIAEPWIDTVERDGQGQIVERRVLFANGIDVDFVVLACEGLDALRQEPLSTITRRGAQVLLDKDGILPVFESSGDPRTLYFPPSQEEFFETVNDFWFHVAWTAKKLRRGELWTARACCDGYMKRRLLTMLEWHAQGRGEVETWYNGRFIERWLDPQFVERLRVVFAHYDEADLWKALRATMHLFDDVASETARQLGYAYSNAQVSWMNEWLVSYQK